MFTFQSGFDVFVNARVSHRLFPQKFYIILSVFRVHLVVAYTVADSPANSDINGMKIPRAFKWRLQCQQDGEPVRINNTHHVWRRGPVWARHDFHAIWDAYKECQLPSTTAARKKQLMELHGVNIWSRIMWYFF